MNKQIIEAIQSRQIIRVGFQKEKTGEFVVRDIAPYDVYPKRKKDGLMDEDFLLGYSDLHSHQPNPVSVYLSNISSVQFLNESFDGGMVLSALKPKERPNIPRSW